MKRDIPILSIKRSPFDVCMDIWVSWISLKDAQHTGGSGNLQDTKEFMKAGEAVERMINDLTRLQWWAVRKARGICTMWHYPDQSFESAFNAAEDILTKKMRMDIDTKRYFN
jgi:hypothetical protein